MKTGHLSLSAAALAIGGAPDDNKLADEQAKQRLELAIEPEELVQLLALETGRRAKRG